MQIQKQRHYSPEEYLHLEVQSDIRNEYFVIGHSSLVK